MVVLTFMYVLALASANVFPNKMQLVSMMMSSGMIFLKCGKVLIVKGLLDQKKDVSGRLERSAAKLSPEEQNAVQYWPAANKQQAAERQQQQQLLQGASDSGAAVIPEVPPETSAAAVRHKPKLGLRQKTDSMEGTELEAIAAASSGKKKSSWGGLMAISVQASIEQEPIIKSDTA